MLWDTTEEISSIVGYNSGDFPPLWDITENNLRMVSNFSCIVSHNVIGYVLLRDTAQEVILRCIPQRRCFSSIVSHIAKETSAFYPTTQKVLFHCGIQQRKMIQCRINLSKC